MLASLVMLMSLVPVLSNIIHVDLTYRPQTRHLQTVQFLKTPLGTGYGTHYAELYYGVPPQKASVIIDTGSHLTAFPCTKNCGQHTDPLFDLSQSSTVSYAKCGHILCKSCTAKKQCFLSQSYSEGSQWTAVLVEDYCWFGSLSPGSTNPRISNYTMRTFGFKFPIGCQQSETGLFITQKANGIMGMSDNPHTVLPYLKKAKRIRQLLFSLCFHPNGGKMVLGGIDPTLHLKSTIAYVPYVKSIPNGWYRVHLLDIQIGNTSLALDSSVYNGGTGMIVDSGTTDSFFPQSARSAFLRLFSKVSDGVSYSSTHGMDLKEVKISNLPDIKLVLQAVGGKGTTVTLIIPPRQYLTKEQGKMQGSYHFSQSSGGVLGANTMLGKDVIFDLEKRRIGFALSNCGGEENYGSGISNDKWTSEGKRKERWFFKLAITCSAVACFIFLLVLVYQKYQNRNSWTQLNDVGDNEAGNESDSSTSRLKDVTASSSDDEDQHHSEGNDSDNDVPVV